MGHERDVDEHAADEHAAGDQVDVRAAVEDDLPAVMNVLDAAMLDVSAADVRDRIAHGEGVLVAVEGGRVLGACLVDATGGRDDEDRSPARVDAIAVRPRRRGQGIGAALVEAAVDRWGPLTAEFDEDVRPFYESLGFEVERASEGRAHGYRRDDG